MSTVQSHIIVDPEAPFNFNPRQPSTAMNGRPDLLRQGGGMPQAQPQMLSLNGPQFMQNQSQQGQQQQHHPSHMGLSNPVNMPMGRLGDGPPNSNNQMVVTPAQRYQLQLQAAGNLQQQQQQRTQMLLRQSQSGQGLNPPGGPLPGSHLNGLVPTSMQGMGLPSNMMPQPGNNVPARRVTSQSQLNPGANHLAGMQQGVGGMSMNMNPQTSMPPHLRQATQQQQQQQVQMQQAQQQQLRMQQHQQQMQTMSPEMAMSMHRTGNPGMPQNLARSASAQAQLMGRLSQPPSHSQPLPTGLGPSHHQNNFQNPMPISSHPQAQISSSPRPGSLPQNHVPPNLSMGTPGSSQASLDRPSRLTPDNGMFMTFQNPQFPSGPHNTPRIQSNMGQFPFVPSSSSPDHLGDPQRGPPGLVNQSGPITRPGFHLTPAQQFEQMQPNGGGGERYDTHFSMPPPNVPPRPPSHNNHNPPVLQQQGGQSQPHHLHPLHQPSHLDIDASGPQRPQSQPQVPLGRPVSQSGPSNTPHSSQAALPLNPGLGPIPNGRPQSSHRSRTPGSGLAALPRPATLPSSVAPNPSFVAPNPPATTSRPADVAAPGMDEHGLGYGQALLRLTQFCSLLAADDKKKLQLSHWNDIIKEYFTPKAIMKFTLWKDNQRNEAKPFEIGVPILPRFFLVTTQSGVKSMTMALDGARERLYATGHAMVECVTAIWTYRYSNGYAVTLRGPLTVHVIMCPPNPPGTPAEPASPPYVLKFDQFQFDAHFHDKYVALDSIMGLRVVDAPKTPRVRNAPTPTANGGISAQQQQREEDKKWDEPRVSIERASYPGEPVNAFGIPQATMRCLELAESVGQMDDLIKFSRDKALGPIEALRQFAAKIRQTQPMNLNQPTLINGSHNLSNGNPYLLPSYPMTQVSSTTLYSTAPPSSNPSSNPLLSNPPPTPSLNSTQNNPASADNSPQKQNKTIPQQSMGQSSTPTSAPPPAPTPIATAPASSSGTPAMANASLKRKQTADTVSPTTVNSDQPPPKRSARKRGRTTGGA